jgi:hypothetical protein
MDGDWNGNNDLVRFCVSWKREWGATQRALGEVTLNMDFVMTTPHLDDGSHERLKTYGALGEVGFH